MLPGAELLSLLFTSSGFFVASILCVIFAMAVAQTAGMKNMKNFGDILTFHDCSPTGRPTTALNS